MNIYSLLLFTSFLIYLYLGFQMFHTRPIPRLSKIFGLLCFAFAHWSFCITFLFPAPHKEAAAFWYKLSSLAWAFIPALLLHFAFVLSGWEQKIRKSWWIYALYLPGAFFAWREITHYVMAADFTLYPYGWTGVVPSDSPLFYTFTLYYLLYVLLSAAVLHRWRRQTESPREKKQAQIIMVAVLISVLLTFINETLLPLLGIDIIPKVPSLLSLFWAYGMWYAISRYRLLDLSPNLTGEIILEELLTKLLQTVIETSGAQRGVIILDQDGALFIQGEAFNDKSNYKLLHNIPLEESSSLPRSLIRQVHSNGERLILDDATKTRPDPYLEQSKSRSLMIIPLLSKGRVKGLLYLENNLHRHVFTPERVENTDRVASQVVQSLENASLFAHLQKSHDQLARWNQMLEETVAQRTQAIKNLLNHAGQGFLTFGNDLLVDEEYSTECEKIFNGPLAKEKITRLLFPENEGEETMLEEILLEIGEEEDEDKKDLYLSLLPEEVTLGERTIQLQFRCIKKSLETEKEERIMLILTDITEKRELENLMEEEKNLLEMIVRIISNYSDFQITVQEYQDFCQNLFLSDSPDSDSIFRQIHTFKGIFHQFKMVNTAKQLHTLETKLQEKKEEKDGDALWDYLQKEGLESWLDEDLALIQNILGDSFLFQEKTHFIPEESLQQIQHRIIESLDPPHIYLLLSEIKKLRWKPFRDSLKPYTHYLNRLSSETEKLIYPLEIQGGELKVDPEYYRDFVKSLGHVFRNAVDHGIELPEERVAKGKNKRGTIKSRIFQEDGQLVVEIADDGQGIQVEKLMGQGRGRTGEIPNSKLQELIFQENFTTQEDPTQISGRGVGLVVVKEEVEKLGGRIQLESQPGKGTCFSFYLPQQEEEDLHRYSTFDYIHLFLEAAWPILKKQGGITLVHDLKKIQLTTQTQLYEYTAIIPLQGLINGRILLTGDEGICRVFLEHFARWDIQEEERETCYQDVLGEFLNHITGHFIQSLSKTGELIHMGPPEKLQAKNASLQGTYNLLRYGVQLTEGSLSFIFIPGTEDFSLSQGEKI